MPPLLIHQACQGPQIQHSPSNQIPMEVTGCFWSATDTSNYGEPAILWIPIPHAPQATKASYNITVNTTPLSGLCGSPFAFVALTAGTVQQFPSSSTYRVASTVPQQLSGTPLTACGVATNVNITTTNTYYIPNLGVGSNYLMIMGWRSAGATGGVSIGIDNVEFFL